MNANTQPQWYEEATVVCACGNTFTTGATVSKIEVEVCSNCHPFYTGQMKFVDRAGRVDAFQAKLAKAQSKVLSKTEKREIKRQKRVERELEKPETLEELRKTASSSKKTKSKK